MTKGLDIETQSARCVAGRMGDAFCCVAQARAAFCPSPVMGLGFCGLTPLMVPAVFAPPVTGEAGVFWHACGSARVTGRGRTLGV